MTPAHELLLRLAGRLPDRLLWRLREWSATGGHAAVGALLPRALLRHRVGLTEHERDLLEAAVAGPGSRRVLDLILPAVDDAAPVFSPAPAEVDAVALSLLAVVRGEAGCVELRQALRHDGRRTQRVVLARAHERHATLAATLARLLRAHGEAAPCVEVLAPDVEPPAYHRAALAASTPLWTRVPVPA